MGTWSEYFNRDFDAHFELDIPSIRTDQDSREVTTSFGGSVFDGQLMNERFFTEERLNTTCNIVEVQSSTHKTRGCTMCDGCNHCDEDGSFSDGDCDRLVIDVPTSPQTECCRRRLANTEMTVDSSLCVESTSLSVGDRENCQIITQVRQASKLSGTDVRHAHPSYPDLDIRTKFRNTNHAITVETLPISTNDNVHCSLAETKTPTDPWTSSKQLRDFTEKNIPKTSGIHRRQLRATEKPTSYRRIYPKPPAANRGESGQHWGQFCKTLPQSLLREFTTTHQVPAKVFMLREDNLVPRVPVGHSSEHGSSLPEEPPKLGIVVSNGHWSEIRPYLPENIQSTSTDPCRTEKRSPQFEKTSITGSSVIETTAVPRPRKRQMKRNYFLKTNPKRKSPSPKLGTGTGLSRRAKIMQKLSAEEADKRRRQINEQERLRQKDLSAAFDALRRLEMPLNPDVSNKDDSKIYLLKTAAAYIAALVKMIQDFDMGLLKPTTTIKETSRVEISDHSLPHHDCKPTSDCKPTKDSVPSLDCEPADDLRPVQLLPTDSLKPALPVSQLANLILPACGSTNGLVSTGDNPIQNESPHPDSMIQYVVPYAAIQTHPTVPIVAPVQYIDPRAFITCDPLFNYYSSMNHQVGFLSPIPNPGFMHPAAVPLYSSPCYPYMATPQNMFYPQDHVPAPPYTGASDFHRHAPLPPSPSSQVLDLAPKGPKPEVDSSVADRSFHDRVQTLHSTPQQNHRVPSQHLEASFPDSTPIRPVNSGTNPATPNDVSSSSKNTTGGSSGYLSLTSPLPHRDSRCFSPDRLNQTMDEMYSAFFPRKSPTQRLNFDIN